MSLPPVGIQLGDPSASCVRSKLGIWLAESGGGFHSDLVFRNDSRDASMEPRKMGMSIFTEQSINRREILASCSILAIIDRKNSLERIEKLLRLQFPGKSSGNESLVCHDPSGRKIFQDSISHWLDRTVISIYLILTKLAIKLKDSKHEQNEDQSNLATSSSVKRAIKELFSYHEEYVRLLPIPGDLTTPMFWNQPEVEKLRSTLLYHSVSEQRELWTKEYEMSIETILKASPLLHEFISRYICCDDYFWACTIVNSRSFPSTLLATSCNIHEVSNLEGRLDHNQKAPNSSSESESQPILLPGVDIFNHRRGAKVEWRSIYLNSQVQRIELVTLEEQLASGEQVFNNYGPKSTAELIMGYGFALSEQDWKNNRSTPGEVKVNNPDDFYTIKLTKPKASEAYSPVIAKMFDGLQNEDFFHHIRRDGHIPPALIAQLRILVISTPEEIDQLDLLYHPYTQLGLDSFQSSKLGWLNELNCLDCLISLIRLKLEDLNQFNHASDELLQWKEVRVPIKKMIQIYRQGQRDILESALQQLNATFTLTLNEARSDGFEYDLDDEC